MFVASGYWDDRATPYDPYDDTWVAGDYRLVSSSPCIDAGDNLAVLPSVITDIAGNPRIINGTIDMGAYEGPNQGFLLSADSLRVPEGGTAAFTVALAMDPCGPVDVIVAIKPGDPDITLESPWTLAFNSSNYSVPQLVKLAVTEDGDNLNGYAIIHLSAPGFSDVEVIAYEQDDESVSDILFVDANASGENNGSSWTDAYLCLQDALSIARANPNVREIRVAQGVYRPAEPNANRAKSFLLVNGVTIKGSYAGLAHPNPNARDISKYKTILSGDLNHNDIQITDPCDLLTEPTKQENSYHVVIAKEGDATTLLDGFIITGGNANGPTYDNDCGGGMYKSSGIATLRDCFFTKNSAAGAGGAMWNEGSAKLHNCTFIANLASGGGAIENRSGSSPDTTALTNCLFANNLATDCGGAILTTCATIDCTNCTFARNSAGGKAFYRGGGICGDDDTYMTLTNCIFWANTDIEGASQQAQIDHDSFPQTHINYCCVQNWTGDLDGIGNTGMDPLLADPNSGDYHLKSQAGRWEPTTQVWTFDNVTSLCIDAGDPSSPIGLEPFPNGGIINMGAYGGTEEASKSYFGEPVCETVVAGDINGDCKVNLLDFAFMAFHWLEKQE